MVMTFDNFFEVVIITKADLAFFDLGYFLFGQKKGAEIIGYCCVLYTFGKKV